VSSFHWMDRADMLRRLIERAHSMFSMSRDRIGERADEPVRGLFTRTTPADTMTEALEWSALIARRV
jgi:hypothetical protein